MFRVIKQVIGFAIIGVLAYLVLGQASLDGAETHGLSNRVTNLVMDLTLDLRGHTERSYSEVSLIIRKLAHFLEYFMYGTVVFVVISFLFKKRWVIVLLALVLTLPIPYIDEVLIQTQTAGRAAHVLDLMIDYMAVGIAMTVGVMYMILDGLTRMSRFATRDSK